MFFFAAKVFTILALVFMATGHFRNCVLYGHGTTEDSPRGVGDCVLRVSSGTCLLADCQVRLRKGHAGFGVVVGPDIVFPFGMRPHAMIKRTEVVHAAWHGGGPGVVAESPCTRTSPNNLAVPSLPLDF